MVVAGGASIGLPSRGRFLRASGMGCFCADHTGVVWVMFGRRGRGGVGVPVYLFLGICGVVSDHGFGFYEAVEVIR